MFPCSQEVLAHVPVFPRTPYMTPTIVSSSYVPNCRGEGIIGKLWSGMGILVVVVETWGFVLFLNIFKI